MSDLTSKLCKSLLDEATRYGATNTYAHALGALSYLAVKAAQGNEWSINEIRKLSGMDNKEEA
jgi:hypothetical protein